MNDIAITLEEFDFIHLQDFKDGVADGLLEGNHKSYQLGGLCQPFQNQLMDLFRTYLLNW